MGLRRAAVQDFEFDLTAVWDFKNDCPFRLFWVVMSSHDGVAFDGSNVLGAASASLNRIIASQTMTEPYWFWLLNKDEGLVADLVPFQSSTPLLQNPKAVEMAPVDIVVLGRDDFSSNVVINDQFNWQPTRYCERPVFLGSANAMWMYYLPGRACWAIGNTIGSLAPCAYVETDSSKLPYETDSTWMVHSDSRAHTGLAVEELQMLDSFTVDTGAFLPDGFVRAEAVHVEKNERKLKPFEMIKLLNKKREVEEQRANFYKAMEEEVSAPKAAKRYSVRPRAQPTNPEPSYPKEGVKPAPTQNEKPPALPTAKKPSGNAAGNASSKSSGKKAGGKSSGKTGGSKPKKGRYEAVITCGPKESVGLGIFNFDGKNYVSGTIPTGPAAKAVRWVYWGVPKPAAGDIVLVWTRITLCRTCFAA